MIKPTDQINAQAKIIQQLSKQFKGQLRMAEEIVVKLKKHEMSAEAEKQIEELNKIRKEINQALAQKDLTKLGTLMARTSAMMIKTANGTFGN